TKASWRHSESPGGSGRTSRRWDDRPGESCRRQTGDNTPNRISPHDTAEFPTHRLPPLGGVSSRFRSRNLNRGPFKAGERVRPLQRRVAAMRTLYPVAVAALVVSCRLDKLLNGGGGNGPPSEAAPARVAFSSSLGNARAGQPISPPVQVTVQDSTGRVTLRDTLVTLSLAAKDRKSTRLNSSHVAISYAVFCLK